MKNESGNVNKTQGGIQMNTNIITANAGTEEDGNITILVWGKGLRELRALRNRIAKKYGKNDMLIQYDNKIVALKSLTRFDYSRIFRMVRLDAWYTEEMTDEVFNTNISNAYSPFEDKKKEVK